MTKRTRAIIVLGASLLNRAAIAERILEVIQAGDPGGTYVIEARDGTGSLVPPKDEDWEFLIVEVTATSTLTFTAGRLDLPPSSPSQGDEIMDDDKSKP